MEDVTLYQVGSFILFWIIMIYVRHKLKKNHEQHMANLQAPLLVTDENVTHRIDTTTKEAEEGFNVCSFCGFENFKRVKFCLICHEQIKTQSESKESCGASASTIDIKKLSRRQVRARKRGEWKRKVDVEGRMFWYRDSINSRLEKSVQQHQQMGGITILFETAMFPNTPTSIGPAPSAPEEKELYVPTAPPTEGSDGRRTYATENDHDDHDRVEPDAPEEPEEEEELAGGNDNIAKAMEKYQNMTFRLVESADANAAQFPTGEIVGSSEYTACSSESAAELLLLQKEVFPMRFSQFVVKTASTLVPAEVEYLKLSVHRDYVLEESIGHLSCVKQKNIHSILRINFLDESGVDAGGLHREWFMLVNDKLTNKQTGLFRCTNKSDQSYYLNPNSRVENGDEHLVYFYAIGRLVGRALLEGTVLNFHFAVPLLKIILGIPVSFDDLEYLDEEAYRSLVWLLEHDHVEELGLDFSVCEVTEPRENDGVQRVDVVDLIPDGRNVAVTDENKDVFVKRKFEYIVFESVAPQLFMFLQGLYQVVPVHLFMLFDHEELDYVLCGTQDIDVDDWEKHTEVSSSLKGSRTLKWFWETVREMPNEYRSRLLQFATGCSRVPPVGFQGLTSYDGRVCPFSLKGVTDPRSQYIHGHACFNRIDLPFFKTRQQLKTVLYGILDEEVYGFTNS